MTLIEFGAVEPEGMAALQGLSVWRTVWNLSYPVGWDQICRAINKACDSFYSCAVWTENAFTGEHTDVDCEKILSAPENSRMVIGGSPQINGLDDMAIAIYIYFHNQTDVVEVTLMEPPVRSRKPLNELVEYSPEGVKKFLKGFLDSLESSMGLPNEDTALRYLTYDPKDVHLPGVRYIGPVFSASDDTDDNPAESENTKQDRTNDLLEDSALSDESKNEQNNSGVRYVNKMPNSTAYGAGDGSCVLSPDSPAKSENTTQDKANVFLVIVSFLIPIVGIILFFVEKKQTPKAAKAYLIAALVPIALSFVSGILQAIVA